MTSLSRVQVIEFGVRVRLKWLHLEPEVRHDGGQEAPKSFRMSSGNRRVYTTFAMKFSPLGEAEPELLEERFLLGGRFGDAAQANLSSIGGGQDDVGAV